MRAKNRILLALTWPNSALQHGVLQFARERHWYVEMPTPDDEIMAREWQGDGIICSLDPTRKSPLTEVVMSLSAPKVEVSYEMPDVRMPRVLEDNAAVGRMAAEYYLNKGFRHFLYVARRSHAWHTRERWESFQEALAERGVESAVWYYEEWHRPSRLIRDMGTRLRKLPHPLAVFCGLDEFAFLVLHAALRAGISVPSEVAILGCGNQELRCDWAEVPISRIRVYTERYGFEAARLLAQMIEGRVARDTVLRVPPDGLVERLSTETLATHDHVVRYALQFIQDNLYRPFNIADIVPGAGVSRTVLERRFRAALNRGIAAETIRLRIENAKQRLRTSDAKGYQIAEELGFSSAYHFHAVFRKITGLTTGEYRAQSSRETRDRITR